MGKNYRKKGDKVYRFDDDGHYDGSLPLTGGKTPPKVSAKAQEGENVVIFEKPTYTPEEMRIGNGIGAKGVMGPLGKYDEEQYIDDEDLYSSEVDEAEAEEMEYLSKMKPLVVTKELYPVAATLEEGDILLRLGNIDIPEHTQVVKVTSLYNKMILIIASRPDSTGNFEDVTYIVSPETQMEIMPPF